MGVNICVYQVHGAEICGRVPTDEWDWIRQGVDRDFQFLTPCAFMDDGQEPSDFILQRPVDIPLERRSLERIPLEYRSRYEKLLDLLENNPSYWVHWSY